MPSCWRAAARSEKKEKRAIIGGAFTAKILDQPGRVKGSRPRETKVMMMS